jgi:16S rRNA U516 pseudouridylate synthase RsuA-like enzyme
MFLSKLLARAGVGSRRDAIRWIESGRVKVDGKVVEWNQKVSEEQNVTFDDKPVR